tara:strand:- start:1145 stop:1579 length:435 start_codon:yes stop_codon:yes gene_type:complete
MDPELNRIDRVGRLQDIQPQPEPMVRREQARERKSDDYMRTLVGLLGRGPVVPDVEEMVGDRTLKVRQASKVIGRAARRRVREPFVKFDDDEPIKMRQAFYEARQDSGGSLIGADGRPTLPARNLRAALKGRGGKIVNRFGREL